MAMMLILAFHALSGAVWAAPPQWPTTSPPPRWQGSDAWQQADFAVVHTELSPAVLVSAKASKVRLFSGRGQWGLGGPTHIGVNAASGSGYLAAPATVAGGAMKDPSIYVTFRGGAGAPQWERPWLVVLQHRPRRVILDSDGLELQFDQSAGFIALLPLWGSYRLQSAPGAPGGVYTVSPSAGQLIRPFSSEERSAIWTRLLRHFPLNCREELQVAPNHGLTARYRFDYLDIPDDWDTPGLKVAPVPPTLQLALSTGFPAALLRPKPEPLDTPTPYGPWTAVRGDSYTVEYAVPYVNETETQQPPNLDDPVVALAAQRVAEVMTGKFTDGGEDRIWDHGGGENFCWQVMGDRYYPRALAYTPEPARSNAVACLKAYFRDWVLNPAKYKPFQDKLLLVGPGIGTWGGYDDAGKFSSNVVETLWCYAYYTGDWDLIRERWDVVKKLFVTPREMRWRGVGRDAIAEMGDEAAAPLCLARMAYQVGDLDMYAYASSIFLRELIDLWVKTNPRCSEWFGSLQPWNSPEPMKGPLFLTNLWGDVAGWQIDGPAYPKETGERQYRNRWVRFGNEDVARFFRDAMPAQVREELDWWPTRKDSPYLPGQSTAHIAPSIEQLRSLLLNEPPDDLARLAPMPKARIGRAADALSYYLSFIRTGRPTKYTRLIPESPTPSPWLLGLEREAEGSDGDLVVHVSTAENQWPVLSDWGWAPPKEANGLPGAKRWSYGQIRAGDAPTVSLKHERLSWTTEVWYSG